MTTRGEGECGEEGDYLAWSETQWTLHGEAALEEMDSKEPCEKELWLNIYKASFTKMESCMHHCEKLGVRAPSVVTQEEFSAYEDFLKQHFYGKGKSDTFWMSVTDEEEEGVWRDF